MSISVISPQSQVHCKSIRFSGGEQHFQISHEDLQKMGTSVDVYTRIQSSSDLMDLILFSDVLRRNKINIEELHIPYFPYARQDRATTAGSPFSLQVVANLINGLNARRVVSYDAHSNVTEVLVNNFINRSPTKFVASALSDIHQRMNTDSVMIVSPDFGALKKTQHYHDATRIFNKTDFIAIGMKTRDPATGNITHYDVVQSAVSDICLITDDICDGGRTFIELAKVLRNKGAKQVFLYVTHGIFSAGLKPFEGLIDGIYTTDSFLSEPIVSLRQNENLILDYYPTIPVF